MKTISTKQMREWISKHEDRKGMPEKADEFDKGWDACLLALGDFVSHVEEGSE